MTELTSCLQHIVDDHAIAIKIFLFVDGSRYCCYLSSKHPGKLRRDNS